MEIKCNCPYCWSELEATSDKPYFYLHPPNFQQKGKCKLFNIFFWKGKLPCDVKIRTIKCEHCNNFFNIEFWPNDFLSDKKLQKQTTTSCNNYLLLEKLVEQSYTIINKIFNTNLKNHLILNTFLVLNMFFFLMFIPSIIFGSIEQLKYDYWLFATPVFFILLLTSFTNQMDIIHKSMNFDNFPISLHENYKKSYHYQIYSKSAIKCFFFGHSTDNIISKVVSPPFLCGLIGCLIGFRFFMYFLPIEPTIFEVVTTNQFNSHIYTSIPFNIGYFLFHVPFWFTIGTIVWVSLMTPNLIAKITNQIPLQINPLQDIGGTELFGEILLKSNISIGILALGVPGYILRNRDILDPTWIYYNILLMSLFIVIIFFSFFYPLYPIHKKMKQHKLKEINDLTNEIDYVKIKNGQLSRDEIAQNILRIELIKKISQKNDWPFNFHILIKIILLSLIPIIQLCISLFSLFPNF